MRKTRNLVPWASGVAIAGIALVAASAGLVGRTLEIERSGRFARASQQVSDAIGARFDQYSNALRQVRALFVVEDGVVSANDFRRFVEALEISRYYPGLQGIGYSRRLAPGDPELARAWPKSDAALRSRIIFLEPADERNRRAIDFDIASEPVRRQAMTRAMETGEATMSAPVVLVQETGKDPQLGFLLYFPLYRTEKIPTTVEARRRELVGWIYAPFRAHDFFRAALTSAGPLMEELDIEVDAGGHSALRLFDLVPEIDARRGKLMQYRSMRVASQEWSMHITPRDGFESTWNRVAVPLILVLGLAIVALLTWVVWSVGRTPGP
jgi:CHASE1-domain containing sensor protein